MTEDYYFLANRISNMEKHIEMLFDWINEISPEIRELTQKTKEDCSEFATLQDPLFLFFIIIFFIKPKQRPLLEEYPIYS